jgi:2-polyprenyl-3-methyl-5-hydroxy-6-metoxy-1,4-benzoquinol methylase
MTQDNDGGKYKKNWNPAEHYKEIEIAENYDKARFSSIPGRIFDRLEKKALRKMMSELPDNSLIMDAPSGTGRLAETLLEMGHRVVGVDISPEMLEVAKKKLKRFGDRYQTINSDVHGLNLEKESFDAVICARVLMHFPLEEQISFLSTVSSYSKGLVVFNQSVITDYHRMRRYVKILLGNQVPASFPLTKNEVGNLITGTLLTEVRRRQVLPLVSEAVFFSCRK